MLLVMLEDIQSWFFVAMFTDKRFRELRFGRGEKVLGKATLRSAHESFDGRPGNQTIQSTSIFFNN